MKTNTHKPLVASAEPGAFQFARVGLDVHKMTIRLACLQGKDFVYEHTFATGNLAELRKALSKLKKLYGELLICYEASGAGFRLHRLITEWGHTCQVIAPSLIPSKAGDRRKCDKLDARRLAQYLGAGLLTEIHVPTADEEAVRDLVRARFTARKDTTRAKHRIVKMLDRKGRFYSGKAWTLEYRDWLKKQEFTTFSERRTFEHYVGNLNVQENQLAQLDKDIEEISKTEPYREQVAVLCGFRGVKTLTAMVFIAELGDIRRFSSPRRLMSYLGLVPSVKQSGGSGNTATGITKAGNSYVRHVLNQASWNYQSKPTVGVTLKERQKGLNASTIAISWKAQTRLYARFHHLSEKRSPVIAIPAVSRELACFLAAAILDLRKRQEKNSGLPEIDVPDSRELVPTQ